VGKVEKSQVRLNSEVVSFTHANKYHLLSGSPSRNRVGAGPPARLAQPRLPSVLSAKSVSGMEMRE